MLNRYFTAKPDASVVTTDRESFQSTVETLGVQGCEYIQTFSWAKISKYFTIVASGQWLHMRNRIDEVSNMYGVHPYEIRKSDDIYHAVYLLSRGTTKWVASRTANTIWELLCSDTQYWTFFSNYETVYSEPMNQVKIEDLDRIGVYFNDAIHSIGDSINDGLINKANFVPASSIAEKFGRTEEIDEELNIIVWFGKPFAYVKSVLGNLDATLKFFNEHFDVGFKIQDVALSTYFKDGILGKSSYLVEYGTWYWVETDKWSKQVTDFTIRVHYKLIRDEETIYAISLVGKDWKKTRIIEWSNSVAEASIIEMVQWLGNYHFITPTKANLIAIHSMIAESNVPSIYVLSKYGRNVFMGTDVVIYLNGVFDINRKMFFPKSEHEQFFFLDGTDGFVVQDMRWNDAEKNLNGLIPSVQGNSVHTFKDYNDIFSKMYKDYTGTYLVMACATYLWFAMFSDENVKYNPIFCGYGQTGSGKTTFADYIRMMLGIEWEPIVFEGGTTIFAILKMLGAINKLPVMCSEFRAGSETSKEKEALFRSLYDRKPIVKGNAQQTITSYDLVASMFVEGEELPNDGAVRSRMIHKMLAKRYRNTDENYDMHQAIESNRGKIASFVNSYQILSDKEVYQECLIEGRNLINKRWREPRIVDNLCMMYAACMAYDKESKDLYLSTIEKMCEELHKDLNSNGTAMQIIKAIATYSAGRWNKLYIDDRRMTVVVPWYELVAFVKRQKLDISLQIESYKDHLVEMWFEEWTFETSCDWDFGKEENCVYWFSIHISQCPRELFTKKEIYQLYKSYEWNKKTR